MAKNIYNLFKNIIEDKFIDFNKPAASKKSSHFKPTLIQIGHLVHFSSTTISYHKHDYWEFAFAVDGKFIANINDKDHIVQKGEIVIYSPNTNHMELPYENENAEIYFLAVDNAFFENYGENYLVDLKDSPVVNSGNLFSQLNMHFMELLIETNNDNLLRTEYIENLGKLILINILRLLKKERHDVLINDMIKEVTAYIDEHYAEDINLDFLAKNASYSKFYFTKLFKEHVGLPPIKYLQQKRLEQSKKLLETTNDSVVKISQDVGFQSQTYYCQLFKKSYHLTPSEYRESLR